MRLERLGEREHGVIDLLVLLAVVCLALVTWSHLADAAGTSLWKPYANVGLTVLFALAALTRHPRWAVLIRFCMGVWLIAAPFILKFTVVGPALSAHLAVGCLLMVVSMPVMTALCIHRMRMVL